MYGCNTTFVRHIPSCCGQRAVCSQFPWFPLDFWEWTAVVNIADIESVARPSHPLHSEAAKQIMHHCHLGLSSSVHCDDHRFYSLRSDSCLACWWHWEQSCIISLHASQCCCRGNKYSTTTSSSSTGSTAALIHCLHLRATRWTMHQSHHPWLEHQWHHLH